MAKRTTHAHEILDQWFGGIAPDVPLTWYIALWRGDPNVAWSGLGEVTAPSYRRAAVPNTTEYWGRLSSRTNTNLSDIVFPIPLHEWATVADPVTHAAFMDAATGGSMRRVVELSSPKTIQANNLTFILVHALQIKEN